MSGLSGKQRYRLRRRLILSRMGGKCVKCGFADWRALELDHVNANPQRDMSSNRSRGGHRGSDHELFKRDRDGTLGEVYQLLCANCHKIKTWQEGDYRPKPSHRAIDHNGNLTELPLFRACKGG